MFYGSVLTGNLPTHGITGKVGENSNKAGFSSSNSPRVMVNDEGARANWHDVKKWASCWRKVIPARVIPARDTPMAAVTYDSPQCPFVQMGSAGQDLEANVTENCKDSFMLRIVSTNLRNKNFKFNNIFVPMKHLHSHWTLEDVASFHLVTFWSSFGGRYHGGLWEIAQLGKCVLCKHTDPSLSPSRHDRGPSWGEHAWGSHWHILQNLEFQANVRSWL